MRERAEKTAVIVDDEPAARTLLRSMLDEYPDVEVVGECGNAQEAIAAVRRLTPGVLFLDVEMPGGDGFTVLEALEPEEIPAVIFTTAHSHYGPQAFEVLALDYLLKPFDEERLEKALARLDRSDRDAAGQGHGPILRFLEELRAERRYSGRLTVDTGKHTLVISTSEINWLEANGRNTLVHSAGQTYTRREGLTELVGRLSPREFLRVHRSTAVRIDRVREIHRWFRGDYYLVLTDGTKLTTGGTYKSVVEDVLLEGQRPPS